MLVVDPLTPRGVTVPAENCRPPTKVREARLRKGAFDAAEHLRKQPFVDPERVGLLGLSQGAMAAFASMQYFVVMIDYGRRGREAIVDPEITRREVVSRVASGEYGNISFIHEIADCSVEDITAEILSEAALPDIGASGADLQSCRFDHIRDLRKHEKA